MSATLHELIGRTIGPPSGPLAPAAQRATAPTQEPLPVLIGRIIAPEWAVRRELPLVAETIRPPAAEAPLPTPPPPAV